MKPKDILTTDEMSSLLKKSDFRGLLEVGSSWALVAIALDIVALWPNPLTVILSLIVLGNRHLALSILVHDACHHSLFKTKWLNDFIGQWLCAAPEMLNLDGYRTYHLQHHKYTGEDYQGSKGDPDIILTRNYPISKKSLTKWLLKDLTGRSAPRLYLGLIAMLLGLMRYDLSGRVAMLPQPKRNIFSWVILAARKLGPFLITNGIFFSILYLLGHGWLYLLWIASALTTFQFFTRVRSIAEHGMLPRVSDLLKNTRTTEASWWERLTFAPHHVNFHLEHHFLIAVPSYRLPKLHRIMKARNALNDSPIAHGYFDVLKLATAK